MQLVDRCVLVTGAASGLGKATVLAMAAAGAKVALVDLNKTRVTELAEELGTNALPLLADVRDESQVQAAISEAMRAFGGLHVAVNCAGVAPSAKIISRGESHDLALWRQTIDINLTGTFNVMRLAAAAMAKNSPDAQSGERGVIINTASIAAFDGQKGQAAYAASKAGVVGLTLPVARDLAPQAIRCVAVAPGVFETELLAQIPEKGLAALQSSFLYPARMGRPSEFAMFIQQIIENPFLNGACLRLDGGVRMP